MCEVEAEEAAAAVESNSTGLKFGLPETGVVQVLVDIAVTRRKHCVCGKIPVQRVK